MSERLTPADVAFFQLETRSTPQHVGSIAIFAAPDGFDYDRLVRLLAERIALAPRYRQRVRAVPGRLANPIWVDDPGFDITFHVRRSALPRPGTEAVLLEFAARIQARLLDRNRPLWEMYLVEGLADASGANGRLAIITKTHPSMVDGRGGLDLAEVLFDESVQARRTVSAQWTPQPELSAAGLVADAVRGVVRRPAQLCETATTAALDARLALDRAAGAVTGAVTMAARAALGRTGAGKTVPGRTADSASTQSATSPLHTKLGQHRRLAVTETQLADFRAVRDSRGGTVNDVVLTVVSGALRGWLLGRGEVLDGATSVRALVPVSVQGAESSAEPAAATHRPPEARTANRVTGLLVELPVGEDDPLRRLSRVQDAMSAHAQSTRSVRADALVAMAGFAPSTLHSLAARAASGLTRRAYSLSVTNVPGPQTARYAAGARMTAMFPILPLNEGQALSVALTSYAGGVFFCVNADRDSVPDVTRITQLITASLAELVAACGSADALAEPILLHSRREQRQ